MKNNSNNNSFDLTKTVTVLDQEIIIEGTAKFAPLMQS